MKYNDAIKYSAESIARHQHDLVLSAATATGKHRLNQLAALHEFLEHHNSPLAEFTSQTLAHESAPVKHLVHSLFPTEPAIPTATGNIHHRLADDKTANFHIADSPDGSSPLIHTVLHIRDNLASPQLHLHAILPIEHTLNFVSQYSPSIAKHLLNKINLHRAQSDFDSQ